MEKRKVYKIIFTIVWVLQVVCEAVAAFSILLLNMLPMRLAIIACAALLILAAVTGLCLLIPPKDTGVGVRRVTAAIVAIIIAAACVVASFMLLRLQKTVTTISNTTGATKTVGVYVMAEDSAQTLADAKDYAFGVNTMNSDDYLPKVVTDMEQELNDGTEFNLIGYDSVTSEIDALYNGSVQAVIIDEAFLDVLSEITGYSDFTSLTRRIYGTTVEYESTAAASGDDDSSSSSGEESGTASEEETTAKQVDIDPFILYVSGSDTRSEMLDTSRSDVNILVVVNPESKQILLVNTPRDYYVANPAGDGAYDKLTHCGIYGIDCSMEALGNLYDEEIDYYAQINFTGFETLIDAIGGITVYSDVEFTARDTTILVGDNYLDGEQALDFVRERYSLSGGDNDRGKNQMKVIKAMIQQLSASTILQNYTEILESLEGMFITDMSTDDISSLFKMQIDDMADWNVQTYAVYGTGGSDYTYSMPSTELYVMYQNETAVNKATELIDKVMAGEVLTDADVNG